MYPGHLDTKSRGDGKPHLEEFHPALRPKKEIRIMRSTFKRYSFKFIYININLHIYTSTLTSLYTVRYSYIYMNVTLN